MMKIVFMGTPDFAVPCLDILIKNYDVQAVFTQPDRPKGRGKKLAMSAVKTRALASDIPVYQPEKLRKSDDKELLKSLQPDIIVVVAYGQILSEELLNIPKYGCINVHASLLPKYRGAAPINWAIVRGETQTGVTTMYMDKGIDTGDMIRKSVVEITEDMTAGQLLDLLSDAGSDLLLETIQGIEAGDLSRTPQIHADSSHAPLMDKTLSIIDFNQSAQTVHNLVRGFNPWPIATTKLAGEKMKVFRTELTDLKSTGRPGEVVSVSKEGIYINCSDYQIVFKEIQLPNKKRMLVEQFILGNSLENGILLGE